MLRPVVIAVALTAIGGVASGEQAPGLTWRAPAGCPDGAAARAIWRRAPPTSTANVTLELDGARAAARVEISTEEGRTSRGFEASTCEAVTKAALVVLALAAGYDGEVEAPSGSSVRPAGAPAEARPPARQTILRLGGEALLDGGRLPSVEPGAGMHVTVGLDRWRLEVGASRWQTARAAVADGSRGATFTLWTGASALCARPVGPLWGCLGAEWGRTVARGFGVREPGAPRATWVAGIASVEADLRLAGSLELVMRITAIAPIRRFRYRFDGEDTLYQARRLGLGVGLGLAWSF